MGNSTDKDENNDSEPGPCGENRAHQVRQSPRPQRQISKKQALKDSGRLNQAQKDIIRQVWETAKKTEFCTRIFKRVFEQRPDFRVAFDCIGKGAWIDESKHFTVFLTTVVDRLCNYSPPVATTTSDMVRQPSPMTTDLQDIQKMSFVLGGRYASLRSSGFKSEFWVTFAECMAMECIYLDAGAHPTPDVLSAWSMLLNLVMGWVRDGYYQKLRVERRLAKPSWASKSVNVSSKSSRVDIGGLVSMSRSYSDSSRRSATTMEQRLA
uniref:Globin family profile domain-containing protein n=1 Tax=Romanomermis culicivorax TaxID=13658 RepID=A0A915L2E4_ROMCU